MAAPVRVALVGALDTKAAEYAYLRDQLQDAGCEAVVVDVGVLGEPGLSADVPREQVAARAGTDIDALRARGERGPGMTAMARGAAEVVADLVQAGDVGGVLAVGGSNAAYVMARVAERLPLGVPKVLLSTMASGDTRPYVGATDLTMMNPVVDINGLNRVSRPALVNAARACAAMAAAPRPAAQDDAPVVAVSMFGVTTPCAARIASLLQADGLEPLSFHANGAGGQALEALVRAGSVQAVADMTTTELADKLFGGVCSAGPDRLTAAGRAGVPQVVSLGALDMVNFGPRSSVPERYQARTLYEHNPEVTLMRTNEQECAALGELLAARLNASRGRRAVVVPTGGLSMISVPGAPFHDPTADAALVDSLTAALEPSVELHVLDTHVNDPQVADAIASLTTTYVREGTHV